MVANNYFSKINGEMGQLIAGKDWSQHPLGSIENWPALLKTTLTLVLKSRHPMVLYWDNEMYTFYNDNFSPSLGTTDKHPKLLGAPAKYFFPEAWDFIQAATQEIWEGKPSKLYENILIPIVRHGKLEDVYWTFSYTPVDDESGNIKGIIIIITEETEKIKALEQVHAEKKKFEESVMYAPMAIAVIKGKDAIFEMANDMYQHITGKTSGELMGKSVSEVFPQIADAMKPIIETTLETGEDYFGKDFEVLLDKNGKEELCYFDFIYHPVKELDSIIVVATDVTDHITSKNLLKISEERYRFLADFMPQFIWIADKEGALYYWNKAVYDYTGFSKEEMMGEPGWISVVHHDDRDENINQWIESIRTGEPFEIEHRFKNKYGEYRWQLSRALPFKNEAGEIEMWVGTSTDIDEMKLLEKQKNDFIKMTNHELKTPVANIKGYTQLLLKTHGEKADPLLKSSLTTIHNQINQLSNLINDMLDISRMESGGLPLKNERFNLSDLVKQTVSELQVANTSHQLILSDDGIKDAFVNADKERITQVLLNLLTNAIKYSPGKDKVDIWVETDGSNAIVNVKDYGIGIDESQHEKLFHRFYRVMGDDESTFPGFGIGLYICSEIMERHGGKIYLKSEKDKGSVFSFSLPLQKS